MAKTSRIPHPPGSRFLLIYAWAVRIFELPGAAILGVLDFLDRAQEHAGHPLASRARIISELEGVVGRNAIDSALKMLLEAKVIRRHVITTLSKRNFLNRVEYSLDLDTLGRILGSPEIGSSRDSLNRELRQLPESGPSQGVSLIGKEIETNAAAQFDAPTFGVAASTNSSKKVRKRRESDIITWTADDVLRSLKVEEKFDLELISVRAD